MTTIINIVYGLFYKDEPIHNVDFYSTDRRGKMIKAPKIPKKFYTKEGYAKNGANNLPKYVDRKFLSIGIYEHTTKIEWKAKE